MLSVMTMWIVGFILSVITGYGVGWYTGIRQGRKYIHERGDNWWDRLPDTPDIDNVGSL